MIKLAALAVCCAGPATASGADFTLNCTLHAKTDESAIGQHLCQALAQQVYDRHGWRHGEGAELPELALDVHLPDPQHLRAQLRWTDASGASGAGPMLDHVVMDRATLPLSSLARFAQTLLQETDVPFLPEPDHQ